MKHPGIEWIKNRVINQNKNCIIIVNGSTGSGKSFASISIAHTLAEELGTHFTIQDNLDFKFTSFIGEEVKVAGQYGGDTLMVSKIEVLD